LAFALVACSGGGGSTSGDDNGDGDGASLECTGGHLFFVGYTPQTGSELWHTDCTAEGTRMVREIYAGDGSGPGVYWDHRIQIGDTLYFPANMPSINAAPWKTDGTAAGTVRIAGSPVDGVGVFNNPVRIGDYIYFSGNDGSTGAEPYRVALDSSTAEQIGDLNDNPTSFSSSSVPHQFTEFAGQVFLIASDPYGGDAIGSELWAYDGDGNFTKFDIRDGSASSSPDELTVAGGLLFFRANDGSIGSEPCYTDGETWTCLDINPGAGSNFSEIVSFEGKAWFDAYDGAAAEHGNELWSSDGETTQLEADVQPGAGSADVGNLIVYDGALYFTAYRPEEGLELWRRKDGEVALFMDIWPGSTGETVNSSGPGGLHVMDGLLYFEADTGDGDTFWRSDGTVGGTYEIAESMGFDTLDPCTSVLLGHAGEFLVLLTDDDGDDLWELWITAGTPETSAMVAEPGIATQSSCEG
jgi:ELWxxDGT repeat protein